MMNKERKILIDTDIGDEIDDALALYLAMRLGMNIVGVTTVFRNTEERARISKRLLKLFGNGYDNVPVYAGEQTPIAAKETDLGHTCHYSAELDESTYAPNGKGDEAVDFIIDCCKKYGDSLTVIAIGPLTNIARVIQREPDLLNGIDKVVIMGGAYFKQYADWNVMCDVEAAKLVLENVKVLECLGADVTHQLTLAESELQRLAALSITSGAEKYIGELMQLWQKENPARLPALHDPLAVYYAAFPDICSVKNQHISVVSDGIARGMTLNVDEYSKAYLNPIYENTELHEMIVAHNVQARRFIDTFMSYFN